MDDTTLDRMFTLIQGEFVRSRNETAEQFAALRAEMNEGFATRAEMNGGFASVRSEIAGFRSEVNQRFDAMSREIAELRRILL